MKSFKLLLAVVFALTALTIPAATTMAVAPQPGLQVNGRNVSSRNEANKWPSLAVGSGKVYVAWSAPNRANFAESGEQGDTFAGQDSPVGSVGSNSTYFNAAVSVGTDNTIHYTWINNGGTIYHTSRTNGVWSVVHTVAAGQSFANTLNITARGESEVFIAWRHDGANNGNIGFAYSNNDGVNWQVIKDVATPQGTYAGRPDLVASTATLPVYLAWTGVDGNVYLATWINANKDFSTECITCTRIGGTKDFFSAVVAMSTDGRPYIAWRSVSKGVYYGSRDVNGTWTFSRAFPDYPEISSVGIAVDKRNNVHMAWLSRQGGSTNAYYAVQKPGPEQFFSNPILVSDGAFKANIDLAVSLRSGDGIAHIAYESFGGAQHIRYSRVLVNGIGCDVSAASNQDRTQVRTIPANGIYVPMILERASGRTIVADC